jgi:hypothetical protein
MITIPVLLNFDDDKPIGWMTLDETKLPEKNTNYVFALGYLAETNEKFTPIEFFGDYKLIGVALQTDAQYLRYLTQKNEGPLV